MTSAPLRISLHTTQGAFISTAKSVPRTILFRGINLSGSSKLPRSYPDPENEGQWLRPMTKGARMASHVLKGFWEGMEQGGEEGWFNGAPLDLDGIGVHLNRLRGWGFNIIRYLIPWEALEHSGPGKYDEAFIDHTIAILRIMGEFGFKVFIDPHQDIWSRATGGSGAPLWTLHLCGLQPRRFKDTGAAYLHCEWREDEEGEFPDMIWQTNQNRLAARTMFTLFFAGKEFAPRCVMETGENVQEFLQGCYVDVYGHLADRLKDAGGLLDEVVIGWDSLNEPSGGLVGIPDLKTFPESQSFKKGPTPTPIQAFVLGTGKKQEDIELHDFTSLGPKKRGSTSLVPPEGRGCWLTAQELLDVDSRWGWKRGAMWDFWSDGNEGCPWAAHGIWDPQNGELKLPTYFHLPGSTSSFPQGEPYNFIQSFYYPHWQAYMRRVKGSHPNAISFINPPVFERPPDMGDEVVGGRGCLSCHFYDGMTLLGKRRHLYNADAVGLQRGLIPMIKALKFGDHSIRSSLRAQLGELGGDAKNHESMGQSKNGQSELGDGGRSFPVCIGEVGVPMDMKPTGVLGFAKGKRGPRDYSQSSQSLDSVLNACDGFNDLGYTIWCYEPNNTHEHGDGWNGEDLSVYSDDDRKQDIALEPIDLSTLLLDGSRAVEAFCRPYPVAVVGRLKRFWFEIDSSEMCVEVTVPGPDFECAKNLEEEVKTVIFLPYIHYRGDVENGSSSQAGRIRGQVDGNDLDWDKNGKAFLDLELKVSEGRVEVAGQKAYWYYDHTGKERTLTFTVKRWGGSMNGKPGVARKIFGQSSDDA